ncbi:MAG: hypothetical protein SNH13_06160 [Rikenellaceae bacterium]
MTTFFKHFTISVALVLVIAGATNRQALAQTQATGEQSEYSTLKTAESQLKSKEDSLTRVITSLRSKFATSTPEQKEAISKSIISSEGLLFELRAKRSALEIKISEMDALEALSSNNSPEANDPKKSASKQIYESYQAKKRLPSQDIASLRKAQINEARVALIASDYSSNYEQLSILSQRYNQANRQEEADSIMTAYNRLDSINTSKAISLTAEWSELYDSKGFAYALLMESIGRKDILDKETSIQQKAASFIVEHEEQTQSRDLLKYYAQKRALTEYEIEISLALNMPNALDSLKKVRSSLDVAEFRYPPISLEERLFIDYEPIKFSSQAQYTGSNPIPDGKVYDKGLIYRILVGTFRTRQAATLFRGAYPLYIIKDNNNMLAYYAGGYATLKEAEAARQTMLKRGFKRPEVVEWSDGTLTNLTRHPRAEANEFRIEVRNQQKLSDSVLNKITTLAPECEISRVGTTFIIGKFTEKLTAKSLVEEITELEPSIEIEIVEIEE